MTTIWLEAGQEKLSPHSPISTLKRPPLYHQVRTLDALRTHDLVINTYNTGTGKTVASLLYLFDLDGQDKNVLFIAPTNALLAQHAEDIEQFVADNALSFKVLRVSAADVRALHSGLRPGETLQRLIRNYLEFEHQSGPPQPIILVVNPDIFYYAIYFRYGAHDRRNIFERFLTAFDYLVVDEFHYYDSKQLANFLFAFALFDQFGYFETRERKVCLLSATPAEQVVTYLDRLFGSRWTRVSPDNEPPESANLKVLPTLTPLELTVLEGDIQLWMSAHRQDLVRWVAQEGLDGALISNSLARVNEAYNVLRAVLAEERMGRITGPEPPAARAEATGRNLILATPTVDIGYNFVKLDKKRQNVDFVICDARYGDELVQRIGRAGRVLGKNETSRPSRAVALLSLDAAQTLRAYDGQSLSRVEFAQIIAASEPLPPRHNLRGYIRTHAIVESFWPTYQISKVLPPDLQDEVEALFARVREIFCPGSRRRIGSLWGFFRKLEHRQRWLHETKEGRIPHNKYTAEHVADWLAWLDREKGRQSPADLQPHLSYLLAGEAQQKALQAFVQSQVAVTRALFSFRDAFQGPTAVIYDPHHTFSSQTVNAYDLLHLIRNYHLSPPMTRGQFRRNCAPTELKGDFYLRLRDQREPRLNLELVYDSEEERHDFEQKWCGCPVALKGIRLQARERGGDVLAGVLDARIVTALAEQHQPMLIISPGDVGPMIARLRGTSLWAHRLTIRFPDSTIDDGYRALLGTAAFHAHAELLGHFLMKERLKSEAIIL